MCCARSRISPRPPRCRSPTTRTRTTSREKTMSDFTSGFWNWYIVLITVLGIAGCAILLWSQSKHKVRIGEDGQLDKTTGHVWDEDLTELNTPMPRWWMGLFYLTIVFAVVYLVLYPGLGSYAGKLGWKSSGAYQLEVKQAN